MHGAASRAMEYVRTIEPQRQASRRRPYILLKRAGEISIVCPHACQENAATGELIIAKHLAAGDWELLAQLQRVADEEHDGHLTICKFTTNWRIEFITPNDRSDIEKLHEGFTFTSAARKALQSD